MKKLPARWMHVVMPLFLSMFMSAFISFISTVKAVGLPPDLFSRWILAWGISWAVAFPTVLMVLPLVRKLAGLVVEQPAKPH
jgi:Protein of unknown function (DUF2798)